MATELATSPPKARPSVADRAALGKAARAVAPRAGQSDLSPASDRDAVAVLEQESESRLPELVPVRYGRMLVSAFTFYRGGAGIMASDLAPLPRTGLHVQLCGDAHLSNFGGFASPERAFVFDLNDFDETLPGPFEWDVKRLAASFEIAGRDRGFSAGDRRAAVLSACSSYRNSMREFAKLGNLDLWYSRLDVTTLEAELRAHQRGKQAKTVQRLSAKARTKNSLKALAKLTHVVDGELRIVSDPPLIVPIGELVDDADKRAQLDASIAELFQAYRETVSSALRPLLEGYRVVDVARKVVGVGSVGTRAWILLLVGRDENDPLFLQIKEAGPSVLEPHLGASEHSNHGQRVVAGQRLMQAASDIFLGWLHVPAGLDGRARDFYVRQLWDWKTSVDTDTILAAGLVAYAEVCGSTLARAHARSGDRVAIASYLGKSDVFDRAVADFAIAYADLNETDYAAVAAAVADGRIEASEGL